MPTHRATGTVASIGYASGPLFLIERNTANYVGSGNAATEASGGASLAEVRATAEELSPA